MRKIDGLSPERCGAWAVITGGSSGIGLAHAELLAASGFMLLLAARRPTELAQAAADLTVAHGAVVETVVADLSTPEGVAAVIAAAAGKDVGIFVSSAGAPLPGWFADSEVADVERSVDLKVNANLRLSHHFARLMRRRRRGGLLLVSSIGGLQGVPYLSGISAAEAYILSLGEGLHHELKPFGVQVSVLLPGPTATPPFFRMLTDPSTRPRGTMTPTAVARESLAAFVAGKPTWIAGRMNRLVTRLLSRQAMSRLMGKMLGRAFGATHSLPAGTD